MLERLATLVRDVFDNYDGPIKRETNAEDIPEWDSLGHIRLITAVEAAFQVRFSVDEIVEMRNLGELADLSERKMSRRRQIYSFLSRVREEHQVEVLRNCPADSFARRITAQSRHDAAARRSARRRFSGRSL